MKLKKLLSVLLSLLLTLCFGLSLAQPAFAAGTLDLAANGWNYRYYLSGYIDLFCYDNTRETENLVVPAKIGSVPVSGFYSGPDYSGTVLRKNDSIKTVTFDLQVGVLPASFAKNCEGLERVTLPDSLVGIEKNAFYGCTALTRVDLPAGLRTIGNSAFYACGNLKDITLPAALQTIGDSAFYGCSSLESITTQSAVRTIGDSAFFACHDLQTVTLNSGLKTIGATAFCNCYALEQITVPDSVTSIGRAAFRSCNAMESITLSRNLSAITSYMLADCSLLQTISIPSGVYSIQDRAFSNCRSLNNVILPSGLHYLEDEAFYGCEALTAIDIPGSVQDIGAFVFANCSSLRTVNVGYGVRTIGESRASSGMAGYIGGTFRNCCNNNAVLTVTLPSSVITLYGTLFDTQTIVYFDGEKRFLDRLEVSSGSLDDKDRFIYRVPVSFTSDVGTPPATMTPYIGERILIPAMAEMPAGYTFVEWRSPNYTADPGAPYTATAQPVTFEAVWTVNEYEVTFITTEGDIPPTQHVTHGGKAVQPDDQVVGSEHIAYWYRLNDIHGTPYDFNEPVYDNLVLAARWDYATQVTVDLTGGSRENMVVFTGRTVYAKLTQSGTVCVPADATMEIISAEGVSYTGSIIAEVPAGNGAYYSYTTNIVNGTASYKPGFGESATVEITFYNTPVVTVNARSDPRAVINDEGDYVTTTDADGLWLLMDGYNTVYVNGSYVNVPEGPTVPADAEMTLTLDPPNGFGCDGTILNGDREIPVYDGQTTYSFLPAGAVTLNLYFYSRAKYVTLYFRNTETDSFFSQTYSKSEDTFTTPECPYSSSHAVFWNWSATV
ncbi:MAG: leucine-rich repeat domain-containing protein, partial [Clostridia bacterium]|nr:leucine-rich repeat domain-containing protein [Clostridia bacterium]